MPDEYVREQSLYQAWQVSPDDAEAIAQWCHGTAVDQGVQVKTNWGTLVIPHGCWVVYDVNNHEFDGLSGEYFSKVCFQESGLAKRVGWLAALLVALVALGILVTGVLD